MNSRNVPFVTLASAAALAVGLTPVLGGCAVERGDSDGPTVDGALVARAAEPEDSVLVLGSTDPAELALTASQTFFSSAPVVVLAPAGDDAAQATAEAAAVELAAPVLLVGGAISDAGLRVELERLGAVAVVDVRADAATPGEAQGDAGAEGGSADVADEGVADDPDAPADGSGTPDPENNDGTALVESLDGVEQVRLEPDALTTAGELDPRDLDDVRDALPARGEPEVLTEVLVLTEPGDDEPAAVATARAAGAVPLEVPTGDPRASAVVVDAIGSAKALAVVGIGPSFGTSSDLAWRLRAAETGDVLPSGTQLAFGTGARYVAVRADAVTPGLVAVDADVAAVAIDRAEAAAEGFAAADEEVVTLPALEVGATRASSSAGDDGDYSTEAPVAELRPFVEAASQAGVQVQLRLEPGASTFQDQVEAYAELLALPGVGLVLDARGRYAEGLSTGVVDPAEVGTALAAVAGVVREQGLPQTLVVLQTTDPEAALSGVDTGAGEIALVVQQVGTGGYGARLDAWRSLGGTLPGGSVGGWTTGSPDPALDVAGVLALDPPPSYVAGR
ncbi:hypothetical protein IF650_10310 [Cellulosimicrobium terreum]|nr:hypothetical protein [Cellulosimicrobium terreum]